jgi:diguanylate cyclase (GGDEF)-like protein
MREQHRAGMDRHIATGESNIIGSRIETTALHADGHPFPVELTLTRLDLDGKIMFTAHMRDLTETNKLKEKIKYQNTHDSLTGLINRTAFETHLEKVIQRGTPSSHHCLLYMDLDQFHVINDSSNHAIGNEMLSRIGQLLLKNKREEDVLARLGSDEFALLLESSEIFCGVEVANKMIELVKSYRFEWDGRHLQTNLSAGLLPIKGNDVDHTELLSLAEAACEMAKSEGRGRLYIYAKDDLDILKHRVDIEWINRIQTALDEGRFLLYQQTLHPIAKNIQTNKTHCEILLRMQDHEGNIISPHQFIKAAERYNLMPVIDKWVIRHTFRWLAEQPDLTEKISFCSINLSALSINDPLFAPFICRQLKKYKLPPELICFEITETAAISNMDRASQFLHELHEAGCLFALDDFGTGSASYAYLRTLPVDFIKIDGSFIKDITNNKVNYTIVKSIHEMSKVMGKMTVAEHVEDVATVDILQQIGLDYVQGYLFSLPQRIDWGPDDIPESYNHNLQSVKKSL